MRLETCLGAVDYSKFEVQHGRPMAARRGGRRERLVLLQGARFEFNERPIKLTPAAWDAMKAAAATGGFTCGTVNLSPRMAASFGRALSAADTTGLDAELVARVVKLCEENRGLRISWEYAT